MKCFVHHEVDAIGVCSECGQGVCDACAVRIGGKLYCKTDADRVFSRKETSDTPEIERPMRIAIASVLFILYGIFGLAVGIALLAGGFVAGAIASFPVASIFTTGTAVASLDMLGIGTLFLAMGAFGIVSGIWLWRMQIWGAVVGSPLLIMGMFIPVFIVIVSHALISFEFLLLVWGLNLVMLILLVGSWGRLGQVPTEVLLE